MGARRQEGEKEGGVCRRTGRSEKGQQVKNKKKGWTCGTIFTAGVKD